MTETTRCDHLLATQGSCFLPRGHRGHHAPRPTMRTILELEEIHSGSSRGKDQALAALNVPLTRYYQLLNQYLDDPVAIAAYPATVRRLRAIRDGRSA